jgi:nicotinamide-nucleotide amidase
MSEDALIRQVAKILTSKKLTISVCESCTGGLLGAAFTSMPGSSKYFLGGVIAYSDVVKQRIVGVKPSTLSSFGAVSAETAREMALGVKHKMNSDIVIAITGIAGPGGGSDEKPVGTVHIALVTNKTFTTQQFRFKGRRQTIRRSACRKALEMLSKGLRDA